MSRALETLAGGTERVTFHNPNNGFVVLKRSWPSGAGKVLLISPTSTRLSSGPTTSRSSLWDGLETGWGEGCTSASGNASLGLVIRLFIEE